MRTNRNMAVIGLLSTLTLGGCAVGGSDYGCKGMPEGVRCVSARDVYDMTASGGPVTPVGHTEIKNPDSRDPEEVTVTKPPIIDPVVDTFVAPALPDRPIPVRTPAVVMRIKVFSWEDSESGALIAPGYIYSEIEPRKWTIGMPDSAANQQGRVFKPLEPAPMVSTTEKRVSN